MSDLDDIIDAYVEKHDALREVYFPSDARCFLLSGDGDLTAYTVKTELVSGWYLKYSKFRGRFELLYATADAQFEKKLSLSGYVAVSGEVYAIDDSETVPPQGKEPFWRIAAARTGGKKFVPSL